MWVLARKNSLMFLINSSILLIILCLHWFAIRKTLDAAMTLFQAQLLTYMVMASLIGTEQREAKTKSLAFLQTLPVSLGEIVASRFMISLIFIFGIALFEFLMYEFIGGPAHLYSFGRTLVFFSALLALVLSGLLYVFNFRYGVSKTLKLGWTVTIGVMVIPFVAIEFIESRKITDFSQVIKTVTGISWTARIGLLTAAGLLYFALERWALRMANRSRG